MIPAKNVTENTGKEAEMMTGIVLRLLGRKFDSGRMRCCTARIMTIIKDPYKRDPDPCAHRLRMLLR